VRPDVIWILFITLAAAHDTRARIQSSPSPRVLRRASTAYYRHALIMSVSKITLSIVPPRPSTLPFHLRPFLEDARGDNPPPSTSLRRPGRITPPSLISASDERLTHLPPPPLPPCRAIDAKRERGVPGARRRRRRRRRPPHVALPRPTPRRSSVNGVGREEEGEVEKLSPRFHPNVTDLTSRGDAARFPRIIILLSYNSFNSRPSKTRGE